MAGIRTTRNGKLDTDNITSMLHNRKYIGEYRYRDIVIPGGIPAIVPEELFNRVQERMAANKKAPAKHKAEDEYLLTTKLYCGKCKCFMVGESGTGRSGQVHRYYKCVSAKHKKGCDKKSVKKEWIENIVINQIQRIILDDELIERLADMTLERQSTNTTLPILHQQYAETERSINNFLNAIQQGIITESTKQRLEELEQLKSEISVQIAKEEIKQPTLSRDQILFWFHRLRKMDVKKLEHRRRLIDSFINSIYLFDDHMVITFNYKDGAKTITFEEIENTINGSDLAGFGAPRRRKLCIVCGDFSLKNHLALTTLLLLSAKGLARFACSLASALATALCRYQPFAVFADPAAFLMKRGSNRRENRRADRKKTVR